MVGFVGVSAGFAPHAPPALGSEACGATLAIVGGMRAELWAVALQPGEFKVFWRNVLR